MCIRNPVKDRIWSYLRKMLTAKCASEYNIFKTRSDIKVKNRIANSRIPGSTPAMTETLHFLVKNNANPKKFPVVIMNSFRMRIP